uniref:Uncharacterized protein n=1 Tax=Taeniopygia guttata TaxID=59729 RepID=A0A674GZ75_TAEGU
MARREAGAAGAALPRGSPGLVVRGRRVGLGIRAPRGALGGRWGTEGCCGHGESRAGRWVRVGTAGCHGAQGVGSGCGWVSGGTGGGLEVQLGVWRYRWVFGGIGGCLEVQVGVWRYRWGFGGTAGCLEVQLGVWRYRWVFGGTGGCLEVQVGVWRYSWVFGGTGGCLEVQLGVWKYRWVFGGTAGGLEVQVGVLRYSWVFGGTGGCFGCWRAPKPGAPRPRAGPGAMGGIGLYSAPRSQSRPGCPGAEVWVPHVGGVGGKLRCRGPHPSLGKGCKHSDMPWDGCHKERKKRTKCSQRFLGVGDAPGSGSSIHRGRSWCDTANLTRAGVGAKGSPVPHDPSFPHRLASMPAPMEV